MPMTQQSVGHEDLEQHKRETRDLLVAEGVLHALGEPSGLLKVQVRQLWEGHYRVNVFTGADAACARVAHSYFLVADGDGNIVASTPKIARQY